MSIAQLLEKMIDYSAGNIHDIDHLIRVWTYAKPSVSWRDWMPTRNSF
jgi:hypothetical protein